MKFSVIFLSILVSSASARRGGLFGRRRRRHRPSGATRPTFTNLNCTEDVSLPTCADRRGNEGVWVCRTRAGEDGEDDDFKSICINPDRAIADKDDCGPCDADTPLIEASATCDAACNCTVSRSNEDGITITFTGKRGKTKSRCLTPARANSVLNSYGNRAACCTPEE